MRNLKISIPNAGDKGWTYDVAFARNQGLVNQSEQNRLKRATIGIPGMGGVGGIHLMTLARMGIGNFKIADEDTFSAANFNRQFGAFTDTIGHDKAAVMADFVRRVNPEVKVDVFEQFLSKENIDTFLTGCDLVIDSLDAFAIQARLMLFEECKARKIPVISAGPIGFSTSMLVMTPDSMDLSTYLNIKPNSAQHEQFVHFIAGLTPKPYFLKYMNTGKIDFKEQNGPSIASSVTLCAGFAAVEALKILLGRGRVHALPHFHYFDPYLGIFKIGRVPFGNRHPIQRAKIWYMKKFRIKLDK